MFNLELYSLHLRSGKLQSTLPGFIAQAPPRKCARGREADYLAVLIDLSGKTNITQDALNDWLEKKALVYYSTPGSSTKALRMMAELINNELLDRNLKAAQEDARVTGTLCLVVLRKDVALSLVIGRGRVLIMEGEAVSEIDDHDNRPHGLGVNQALTYVFSQNRIGNGASILLEGAPNTQWTTSLLAGAGSMTGDALVRRLISQRPANTRAALVHLSEGSGSIETRQIKDVSLMDDPPPGLDFTEKMEELLQPALLDFSEPEAQPVPGSRPATDLKKSLDPLKEPDAQQAGEPARAGRRRRLLAGFNRNAATKPSLDKEQLKAQVGRTVSAVDEAQEKAQRRSSVFFSKLFASDGAVPRSMLLLLAIVIPLVVVAIAGAVYLGQGRTQQFAYYYQQGQQYAIQADAEKDDEIMQLFNLQAAVMYLEKASEFGQTAESYALLTTVQAQLDAIQGVSRLELTSLNISDAMGMINITQMVATNNDLYFLDGISGKVLRYTLNGNMYVKDRGFDCGPNDDNPLNSINEIVDILPLPVGNSFGATLLGIDVIGNIEFCIPGKQGNVTTLIAPDVGWRGIKAIAMYQNLLYVLDPGNNGVYVYPAKGILFEDKPTLFFDHTIPALQNAIDLEVNADELYILRSNGEMVTCTYSHLKDYKLTECQDPAPFSDMRSGNEPQPLFFPESQFVQMRITPAPDSSIYILDTHGSSLFHFSLQRNLQRVIQPVFIEAGARPKGAASSIAISPGKLAFIAFGNRVYFGALP